MEFDKEDLLKFIFLLDEKNTTKLLTLDELHDYSTTLANLRRSRIIDSDMIADARFNLDKIRSVFRKEQERIANKPRKDAQKFIAKKHTRETVFLLHGSRCLKCYSESNIALDHVVPIFLGGENKIENLQPLCQSCNSKKGTKIIDYRKEVNNG